MINKDILNGSPDQLCDGKIYLIEQLSSKCGFFKSHGRLLFVVFDADHEEPNSTKTNFMKMETHVYINSIENDNSFRSGYCNVIEYIGDTQTKEFDSFVELCEFYSKNQQNPSFNEFFYAMLELFQLPPVESFTNAEGLYGELKFLEHIKNNYSVDLSRHWHISGPYSNQDICFNNYRIEIKSSAKGNCVEIKHNQLFNAHENYLAAVECEPFAAGESLHELESKMVNLFPDLSFAVKLKEELRRIKPYDIENQTFSLNAIHIYHAKEINPFSEVPDAVSSLKYRLDLSNMPKLSDEEITILLSKI